MIPHEMHLQIGSLLFEGLDQIDLTGPFEVFSRLPNSTYRIFAKTAEPVRDVRGLTITPNAVLTDAPQLDLLHVPGGFGQESVMDDEEILSWVQQQAAGARCVFSVCTGALICGAAGLLKGRRATTHWAALHLLPFFGAIPSNERVVVDGESMCSPRALRLVSMVPFWSPRRYAAMKLLKLSNCTCNTHPSRLSTAGSPRPRLLKSLRRHVMRSKPSRSSGSQQPDA